MISKFRKISRIDYTYPMSLIRGKILESDYLQIKGFIEHI